MSNEKNIEELKTRLLALGFPAELEAGLRAHICFGQEAFTLQYRGLREGDVLHVSLQFQKVEGGADYSCLYYDACLRKHVEIPPTLFGEVDTSELEARMKGVDWLSALPSLFTDETARSHSSPFGEKEEAVEGIVSDLAKLCETPEGEALAHRLKVKFWMDTPLEGFIPNGALQKSSMEVGQRFYFFEGEAGITLDEAYRFLSHRWREKQWHPRKKRTQASGAATQGEGSGRGASHKLGPGKRSGKESKRKG